MQYLRDIFLNRRDLLLAAISALLYVWALTWWPIVLLAGTGVLLSYCLVEKRLAKFKRLQGCGLVLGTAGVISVLILLLPCGTLISTNSTIQVITEVQATYNNDKVSKLPESLKASYESLERSWNTDLEADAKEVFHNNCEVALIEYKKISRSALVHLLGCLTVGICGFAVFVVSGIQYERSRLHL